MTETARRIVVGVDGSPAARAALVHALEDAARRGATVLAVGVVSPPEYWASIYGMPMPPPPAEITAAAVAAVRHDLDQVLADRPDLAGVPVSVEGRLGHVGEELVDAADDADLLVLGHRGRGAVASALLGSVGLYCLLHAGCPVTVVRAAGVTAPGVAVG
ncbi:universal stress protein [Actinomycetes bacterium KLBMP 9759]